MKQLFLTLTIMAALSTASFGQIETRYRLSVSDGDSTLVKYTYKAYLKQENRVIVFYQHEVFNLDTVSLKSSEIREPISLNDYINGNSIEAILNSLYNVNDSLKLKAIMRKAIIKERRGK